MMIIEMDRSNANSVNNPSNNPIEKGMLNRMMPL